MAKSKERILACELRKQGMSIKAIAAAVSVSTSTASVWCSDISLTSEQVAALDASKRVVQMRVLLKGAHRNRQKKLDRIAFHEAAAVRQLADVGNRDLLLAGIGLYWGEGVKKGNVAMVNSDPGLILLSMRWFIECLGVERSRFRPRIFINQLHEDRVAIVEEYWSRTLSLPRNQFAKTVLIRRENAKVYENHDVYYGVMALRVSKGTEVKYRILGLIKALGNTLV